MGILSMGKTPRPICDVCNEKVAEMEISSYSGDGYMTVTVRCHGETQQMRISNQFAASMDKNTEVGRAFVREKIDEEKRRALPSPEAPSPKGE